MNDHQEHVLETFRSQGAGFSYVLAPEDIEPSYCCTYGWSINYGLPELIAFGTQLMALRVLPQQFDGLVDALDEGFAIADGTVWPMRINDHDMVGRFVDASHFATDRFEDARLCRSLATPPSVMSAYQLFWADADGYFPWDGACSELCRSLQPLLYRRDDLGG